MFPSVNSRCTQNVSPEHMECKSNLRSFDGSFQRRNLAGGTGVFSNFFKEMAEPNSSSDVPNHKCDKGGCDSNNDEYFDEVVQYFEEPPIEEDSDMPQSFYCRPQEDEDLDMLIRYGTFTQNEESYFPFSESPSDGRRDVWDPNAASHGYAMSGTTPPIDLTELLLSGEQKSGISYPLRRCKPPKVLVDRFLLGDTVGRGSYGKVKDAIDLVTLKRHAVKVISRLAVRKIPGGWHQALLEAGVMRRLSSHYNIVSLLAVLHVSMPSERLCIVMEHCLGSVHDLQAAGVPFFPEVDEDEEGVLGEEVPSSDVLQATGQPRRAGHLGGSSRCRIPWLAGRPKRCSTQLGCTTNDNDTEGGGNSILNALRPRKVSNIDFNSNRLNNDKPWGAWRGKQPQQQPQQQFRRLSEAQSHAYFLQLLEGLHFLHRSGVIHRDIKPANLLLTLMPGCGLSDLRHPDDLDQATEQSQLSSGSSSGGSQLTGRSLANLLALSRGWLIKLTDFGVSASLSAYSAGDMVSGGQTTPAVQPPEVAKGVESQFAGGKLDVYSAGVTLYFMLTGRVPFSCAYVLQIFEAIAQGDYTIPGHVSAEAAGLVRKMMAKDAKKRFSLSKVSSHPWVQGRPSPPVSLEVVRQRLLSSPVHTPTDTNSRAQVRTTSVSCRGQVTWLEPLVYLRRPLPEYPLPHIDENGARIFSLEELDRMLALDSGADASVDAEESPEQTSALSDNDSEEEDDRQVAPSCFAERLRVYHLWKETKASTTISVTPLLSAPPLDSRRLLASANCYDDEMAPHFSGLRTGCMGRTGRWCQLLPSSSPPPLSPLHRPLSRNGGPTGEHAHLLPLCESGRLSTAATGVAGRDFRREDAPGSSTEVGGASS